MKSYIEKCLAGEHLTESEASSALEAILTGQATGAEIAGFLVAMRAKGESVSELVGFATVMREGSVKVKVDDPDAMDIVGTGGDGLGTFNISTVAMFVVAGAGVVVAKHGNRAFSSRSGSADTLTALGVNIHLEPVKVQDCINAVGVGFLFAPLFHPAMKSVAKARAELGIRTIFNLLGPLTNPAGVTRQLVGTYHASAAAKLAGALSQLRTTRACVVHGEDGMDEIAISGTTNVIEVNGSHRGSSYALSPADFGFSAVPVSALAGGDITVNADIALRILHGERGAPRDVVLANSAFGIHIAGKAGSLRDGQEMASQSLDSGRALGKLKELIAFTNRA